MSMGIGAAPLRRLRALVVVRTKTKITLGLGALSAGMYYGLYVFNDQIRQWAEITSQGDKTFFLVPIGIAFGFSVVHGLFTDRFWDGLGLKARR